MTSDMLLAGLLAVTIILFLTDRLSSISWRSWSCWRSSSRAP